MITRERLREAGKTIYQDRGLRLFWLFFLLVALVVGIDKIWLEPQPSADDRYGCTVRNQAPNGECQ